MICPQEQHKDTEGAITLLFAYIFAFTQKRVEVLEKLLKRRMEPFLKGDKEAFQREIQKEANKLASMPFGVPLMHIIG